MRFRRLWCCLLRRFLAVDIVYARLGFQDLVFGDLTSMFSFIDRGHLYGLLILFCPPSLYVLSSRCSFHCCSELWWLSLMPCLSFYVWIIFFFVYAMWLGRLFLVSRLVSDFSVVGFHSLSLSLSLSGCFSCFAASLCIGVRC